MIKKYFVQKIIYTSRISYDMICIYEVYKLILKYLTEELPEAFQHTFLYSVVLFIEYYLYRKKVYYEKK